MKFGEKGELKEQRVQAEIENVAEDPWWWD